MVQNRLDAFEMMLAAVQREYADILSKMEKLKAEKKVKTVTYQQLLSRKLMYQNMISLYQLYDLVEEENST
ncbi:MAG: hypothetical protein K2O71_03755, partial [Lachnospiraceae bacterium]|nr:hypothetical protein [Lachnospiraceae bacterium]